MATIRIQGGWSSSSAANPGITNIDHTWLTSYGSDDRFHSIGTTEESITFTDISVNGWVKLENTDATNYVQVGFSTGVYGIRLKAGFSAVFFLEPGATIYLKANTAACRVRASHLGAV
jgi:hypothetical protein